MEFKEESREAQRFSADAKDERHGDGLPPAPRAPVFNNYGDKGNEELLMTYGFALKHNEHETSLAHALLQHVRRRERRRG